MPLNTPDPSASYTWMLNQLETFRRIIGDTEEGIVEVISLRNILEDRLRKEGYIDTFDAMSMTHTVFKGGNQQ